jgi:tetratricopeptide (TPR) repeat protein
MKTTTAFLFLSVLVAGSALADEAAPNDPKALVEQASLLAEDPDSLTSRRADIEGLLRRAIELDPRMVEARFNLVLLHYHAADFAAARAELEKVLQLDPQYASARAMRGVLLLRDGQSAEGRAELDAAVLTDPYNPIANAELAALAYAAGSNDEAIRLGRLALLIDSDNVNAYVAIAMAYRRMGSANLSKLVCYNAIGMSPKAAPIYNILGLLALDEDQVKIAIGQFEKAVEFEPDFVEARMNLGAVMLNYGDFAGALQHFEAVLKLQPDNLDATLSLAVVHRGLGKYPEAAAGYEKVLRLRPGNLGALYNRCILFQEYMSEYEKALEHCRVMLGSIDKKHPDYKEMTDRVSGIEQTIQVMKQMKDQPAPPVETPPEAQPPADAAPAAEGAK